MNTNCVVRFDTRTLVVTRYFLKRASVPFSQEYDMLAHLTKQHPDFTVEVKVTAHRKPQFMPTYDDMLGYIHRQSDAAKLVEEFNAVRQMARMYNSAYMYVRRWFLMRFPEMGQAA